MDLLMFFFRWNMIGLKKTFFRMEFLENVNNYALFTRSPHLLQLVRRHTGGTPHTLYRQVCDLFFFRFWVYKNRQDTYIPRWDKYSLMDPREITAVTRVRSELVWACIGVHNSLTRQRQASNASDQNWNTFLPILCDCHGHLDRDYEERENHWNVIRIEINFYQYCAIASDTWSEIMKGGKIIRMSSPH